MIFPPAHVISLVYLVEIFATDKSNTAFTRKTRSSYDIIVMSSNLKTLVFNLFVCSLIYWFILPFSTVLLESNCITYAIIVCTICTFIKSFQITSTRRSEDRTNRFQQMYECKCTDFFKLSSLLVLFDRSCTYSYGKSIEMTNNNCTN